MDARCLLIKENMSFCHVSDAVWTEELQGV